MIRIALADRGAAAALAERAADLTPAMQRIGGALADSTRRRIAMRRGPDGNPWPPALRSRPSTGRLAASIGVRAGPDVVAVASDLPWAAALQHGTRRAAPRPFLGLDEDDETTVLALLAEHLTAGGAVPLAGHP